MLDEENTVEYKYTGDESKGFFDLANSQLEKMEDVSMKAALGAALEAGWPEGLTRDHLDLVRMQVDYALVPLQDALQVIRELGGVKDHAFVKTLLLAVQTVWALHVYIEGETWQQGYEDQQQAEAAKA
jgi:hypothetical protein